MLVPSVVSKEAKAHCSFHLNFCISSLRSLIYYSSYLKYPYQVEALWASALVTSLGKMTPRHCNALKLKRLQQRLRAHSHDVGRQRLRGRP